jgi:hypothetical protein
MKHLKHVVLLAALIGALFVPHTATSQFGKIIAQGTTNGNICQAWNTSGNGLAWLNWIQYNQLSDVGSPGAQGSNQGGARMWKMPQTINPNFYQRGLRIGAANNGQTTGGMHIWKQPNSNVMTAMACDCGSSTTKWYCIELSVSNETPPAAFWQSNSLKFYN